ncbi:MAG: hypothetical protein LBQ71_11665 [Hungatella sp.]|nr:hypothetical protein [Hungatella sp.]
MYKPQAEAHAMCGSTSQQITAFSHTMKTPAATRCPAVGPFNRQLRKTRFASLS